MQLRAFQKPLVRAVLILALFIAAICTCTTAEAPRPRAKAVHTPVFNISSYVVKPGDTFAGIMDELGVPAVHAHNYYSTLQEVGFSTLFPGDSMIITRDEKSSVRKVSLLSRLNSWYHINRSADTILQAEKRPLDITTYRCLVRGTLKSSLSEDLLDLGVGESIASQLADIFAWDINFFVDPQPGDQFEIVFEKNYREGRFEGYGRIISAAYVNQGRAFHAISHEDSNGRSSYYDITGKSVRKQFLKAPLSFRRISSTFTYHRKHPVLGIVRPHLGIDYAAPSGTPIVAPANGRVSFAGWKGGYGNHIIISHGGNYQTLYGHLSRIAKGIRAGSSVSQGDLIGLVGSTGLSSGPHLDYRMKLGARFINPLTLVTPAAARIPLQEEPQFSNEKQTALFEQGSRFAGRSGSWVLNVDIPDATTGIVTATAILPQLADGH